MTDVYLDDPNDLVEDEERYLKLILKMPPKEFDKHMRRHVASPSPSGQFVFRHPEVVELSNDSLIRLIATEQQKKQHLLVRFKGRRASAEERTKADEIRTVIDEQIRKYQRERKVIKPYLNLALTEAARNSDRNIASRVVARVLYDEYTRHVIRDIKNGMTEPEAEAAMRARIAESR